MPASFEVAVTAEGFRLGRLRTPHGEIETPVFMPVGTQATVKTMLPSELEQIGVSILLANAYHLNLRPGADLIARRGGLHRFMGWSKPILTDSGGYQVFSLSPLRTVQEHGVVFRSHLDGAECFLGPREAMEIQRNLGSDIAMVLDECPPWPCNESTAREAVERSIRWARECRAWKDRAAAGPGALLFGIVQGGSHAALRDECARRLVEIGFDGYAIGGVSVGEPEPEMLRAVEASVPALPEDRPRYAMGLGSPTQILEMVARGVDMFDCVLPTRVARNGVAFTPEGYLHISAGRYREAEGPLQEGCPCPACRGFSRAYLRHLFNTEEILALRLVTWHNLTFYLRLMGDLRDAIRHNAFAAFRREFLARYKAPATPRSFERFRPRPPRAGRKPPPESLP
ncbi:MAG: tRNA guanosine(34) transglycosylase Tgt [Verrucomicrobiae bacterium]|nr:tRNA guanosine(34) transglycosylase Tgt [Verrucomicrobiae bacterium]